MWGDGERETKKGVENDARRRSEAVADVVVPVAGAGDVVDRDREAVDRAEK